MTGKPTKMAQVEQTKRSLLGSSTTANPYDAMLARIDLELAKNEFEAKNRQRKVLSLCVAIDAGLASHGIPDTSTEALDRVQQLDEQGWITAAKVAGCKNPPSEITRGLVIDIYKRRVEGVSRVIARSATAHAVVGAL